MVDVELGGLAALEEDELARIEGLPQDERGVGHVRAQPLGETEEFLHDLVDGDRPTVVDLD